MRLENLIAKFEMVLKTSSRPVSHSARRRAMLWCALGIAIATILVYLTHLDKVYVASLYLVILVAAFVITAIRSGAPVEPERTEIFLDGEQASAGDDASRIQLQIDAVEGVIAAAVEQIAPAAKNRVVRTNIGDANVLRAQFDFDCTMSILGTMLENAITGSPSDVPIDIDVRRVGDCIEIAVFAGGPGVQYSAGLSDVQRLAEAQFGGLRDELRSGGRTFVLSLPVAELTGINVFPESS